MGNATAFSIGQLAGSVVGIFILYALWEFALFKRVMDDPVKGKSASVLAAYLTASVLYGFGSADGGPFNPLGFITYLFGMAIVGFFAIRRGMKLRDEITPDQEIEETFG